MSVQPQPLTGDQLQQVIGATLSPYAETRNSAENSLKLAQQVPSHHLEVLRLVAGEGAIEPQIRQAAAVHFKNLIKKGWDTNREEGTEGIVISPQDRSTIKTHLVQLMCSVPSQIQVLLSETISLIAAVDYPSQWDNLLPELVSQFNTTDPNVLLGILTTANSIFKRFRYVQRSDDLYRVIAYTLKGIQEPLLTLFVNTGKAVETMANDAAQLKPRLEALRIMCRIFFSLNYQDLPEFFEDHMKEWMTEFAKYLQYQNPVVVDAAEETDPGPIDSLQAAIIENLALYASKDEELFVQEYLPQFTRLVWNLLMGVTAYPKHDSLATTSIRFLSSLVEKVMHKNLFQDESTLRQIVTRIVIPNLYFRESDEEKFEDDPREFIVTEVEGSDNESRRKCSQDLLRAMCRHFEPQTTAICSEHVGTMLAEFNNDQNKWASKDAAIHLMVGIAVRKQSSIGVSEVNEAVNVMDFFQSQILPELQDANHTSRPVVKASAIKFVSIFRNQFSRENTVQLMPLLISHLTSPIVVVHTFAAYTIERILCVKEDIPGGGKAPKMGSAELKQFLEPLFTGLFTIVDNPEQNENDYVMKCVMRALSTAGEDVVPVTETVLNKLTAALVRVAKNPRNPQFNHYLFESIAVLVGSVCSKDATAVEKFEPLLFEPFTSVLQQDIAELSPYVFQVLAQLLEFRPAGTGLSQAYSALFPPLLQPTTWERKGNVPAMARLVQAYIQKAPAELVPSINGVLGIFQKLIATPITEASAFDILNSSLIHIQQETMDSRISTIFQVLLTRLQTKKTPRYTRLVTTFFALFVGKYGVQVFVERMNSVQAGLAVLLLVQVWNPRLQSDPPTHRNEAKMHAVGLTKLLCDSAALLNSGQEVWSQTLATLMILLTSPTFSNVSTSDEMVLDEEVEIGYDAQYSRLRFANRPSEDPFPEVTDPSLAFVRALHRFSSSQPGQLMPLIQQSMTSDPKLLRSLESMFTNAGLNLA